MAPNPMTTLGHAVAVGMVQGPLPALALLEPLDADNRLSGHHRLYAVRAHLLEMAGDREAALSSYRQAVRLTSSLPEQHYLRSRASRLIDVKGRSMQQGHGAVRASYDAVAEEYADGFRDELDGKPLDRALLAGLVEQTEAGGPIADLGCGPGHVAAWLTERGVSAVGIDLSAAMVAAARREHPSAEFREGDLLALPATDGEFGSAVAFYSIIHLDPGELRRAFDEVHRVLRPAGRLLVTFHLGTEVRHLDDWFGHEVDVDFHFFETSHVVKVLQDAGFTVEMRMERTHYPDEVDTRRAYLLARRG